MCQLTFINTNNEEFNKRFLVTQCLMNTVNTHRDGWGFFVEEFGIFKTRLHPWETSNLGSIIGEKIKTANPILAHVRLASLINNKREIIDENSHPFETKDFIVAHNGRFDGEVISKEEYKDKIDSEIFAITLQKTYDKFPKMKAHKLIKETYDTHFSGKFALLIYFKPTKRFYVAVGRTADLHKIDIFEGENAKKNKKIGFIINTDKADLQKSFKFTSKMFQIEGKFNFFISEVEELKDNTVYIVNTTYLREVGSIVETIKTTTTAYDSDYYKNQHHHETRRGFPPNTHTPATTAFVKSEVDFLIKLHDDFGLSAAEIDTLFLEITGFSPISAEKEQFKLFEELTQPFLLYYSKNKKDIWTKLTDNVVNPIEAYNGFELQFPYFLNEIKTLEERWIKVKNANKKGGSK